MKVTYFNINTIPKKLLKSVIELKMHNWHDFKNLTIPEENILH